MICLSVNNLLKADKVQFSVFGVSEKLPTPEITYN